VFGEAAIDMPPLRTIQESGITWGLGSDGTRANQILPFTTLWWAVTGKMVGRRTVISPEQTISREDALIAHTRRKRVSSCFARTISDRSARKARGPARPRSRLPDDSPRSDQGHQAGMTMVGGRIVFGS
jgi:hypothetical protein